MAVLVLRPSWPARPAASRSGQATTARQLSLPLLMLLLLLLPLLLLRPRLRRSVCALLGESGGCGAGWLCWLLILSWMRWALPCGRVSMLPCVRC